MSQLHNRALQEDSYEFRDEDLLSLREDRDVLVSLLYLNFKEAIEACLNFMLKLKTRAPVNQIAWYARNLLELQIWVNFCSSSLENAFSFYEDSIRDLIDINRGEGEKDPKMTEELEKITRYLSDERKPHKYQSTSDVAERLGAKDENQTWSDYFRTQNKLLSKFVHPTALSVVLPIPKKNVRAIQSQFSNAGEEYGREALTVLEESLIKKLHAQYGERYAASQKLARLHNLPFNEHAHFMQHKD